MLHFDLTDQYHERASALHRLDPRTKVVLALAYILAVSLAPVGVWWAFAALLVISLAASLVSGLGLTFALRRSYLALPFVLAALPLPFTTPGTPLFTVPWLGWTASLPGTLRLLTVLLRTWMAVQAAILLAATTRLPDLLWALGAMHMPKVLTSTIGFMYRYLFVLLDEALHMLRARLARAARRTGGRRPPIIWEARVAGGMVGSLFLRAIERSERVYSAMLARGYDGQTRSLTRFRMTAADWLWIGFSAAGLGGLLSAAYTL